MHYRTILGVLGRLLLVTGASLLLPVACSLWYRGEGDTPALLISAGISAGAGALLWWRFRADQELDVRDALLIATLGWTLVSAVSALPFAFHGSIPSFTDGFFEMMSGYTTTGSTILTDIEALPHGLLFWRSQTHLLGGMGFLTLTVVFLPHGVGGLRIFRAEASPGQVISRERIAPRNRDAMVYFVVNVAIVLFGGCLMVVIADLDHGSAMSSVIATLMNIGPGFGSVGPTENFAHVSVAGKWFLSWCMLVGRLDVFTALVVFYPSFWSR